jgi:hypothetical protein
MSELQRLCNEKTYLTSLALNVTGPTCFFFCTNQAPTVFAIVNPSAKNDLIASDTFLVSVSLNALEPGDERKGKYVGFLRIQSIQ